MIQRFSLVLALVLSIAGCGGGSAPLPVVKSASNGLILLPGAPASIEARIDVGRAARAGETVLLTAPTVGPGGTFTNPAPEGPNTFRGVADSTGVVQAELTSNGIPGPYLVSVDVEGSGTHGTIAITNMDAAPSVALSGAQARERAEQSVSRPRGAILHGPVLLPVGTDISVFEPSDKAAQTRSSRAVTVLSWFCWVDDDPNSAFSKPVRFISLDATNANAAPQVTQHTWFPIIYTPGSTKNAWLIPAAEHDLGNTVRSVRAGFSRAPADACAIVVRGPGRRGSKTDVQRYKAWLIRSGRVNEGEIYTQEHPITKDELFAAIDAAKQKGCKKIYLYISAHGFREGCALSDADANGNTVNGTLWYTVLGRRLRGIDQICASVDACYAGTAITSFQNLGLSGATATSSDSNSYGYMNDQDGYTGFWTKAFIECADDLLAQHPTQEPHWDEIQAWVNKSTVTHVTKGHPSVGAIGETAPESFTIPPAYVPNAGTSITVTLTRPAAAPADDPCEGTLTFAQGGIATTTTTVNFAANEFSKTVTVTGVADGETTWTYEGRVFNGTKVKSNAAPVRVGSSYRFSPQEIDLTVKETREISLFRFGALTLGSFTTTPVIGSSDLQIVAPAKSSVTFANGDNLELFNITAGTKTGTTTIVAFDAAYQLQAVLIVRVHQELTVGATLTSPGNPTINVGAKISTSRITGAHIGMPEEGCSSWHLHADNPAGIYIDGVGPYPDPRPHNCGYGLVIQP